jgi:putative hemolysin
MTDQAITDENLTSPHAYRTFVTDDPRWVEEVQRLRWIVFSAEYGRQFSAATPGLDSDQYDKFCQHIVTLDEESGTVVGTYRILDYEGARAAGGRFAEQHFDLSGLATIEPSSLAELGRSCVHPDHQNGTVISSLWAELYRYTAQCGFRWLGGCLSIPLVDDGKQAASTWDIVSQKYLSPSEYRVRPLIPWLENKVEVPERRMPIPRLLRGYFRAGAWVCGPPAHDVSFPCVDLFVLIDRNRIDARYRQRYQSSHTS